MSIFHDDDFNFTIDEEWLDMAYDSYKAYVNRECNRNNDNTFLYDHLAESKGAFKFFMHLKNILERNKIMQ